MSWTTIGVSDEQVDAVATGSNVHGDDRAPAQDEVGLMPMLPRALAERLHAALGEALAQCGGASGA